MREKDRKGMDRNDAEAVDRIEAYFQDPGFWASTWNLRALRAVLTKEQRKKAERGFELSNLLHVFAPRPDLRDKVEDWEKERDRIRKELNYWD
jgi:hypothetical protein